MKFHLLSLFPAMFDGPLTESIIRRAVDRGLVAIDRHNIRDYAFDRHQTTDDAPYGGGAGMVMKVDPIAACIDAIRAGGGGGKVLLTTPKGQPFSQALAAELAAERELTIICGRYEGVDERVRELYVDREVSLGDFVMTGGEIAAMAIVDAVARLVPGVLGSDESALDESFADGLLEYPHYTRPVEFRGHRVPEILLSGNHREIARWRRHRSLEKTVQMRPDLLASARLTDQDRRFLNERPGE